MLQPQISVPRGERPFPITLETSLESLVKLDITYNSIRLQKQTFNTGFIAG